MRRRLAVVFQESLLLNTTVWDNMTLGMRMRGFTKEEQKDKSNIWLERFGVASLAKRQARTLSGGEAKRVSLASAFALQPEILFLDEPFAALDKPTHEALIEDFESVLNETRITAVMVTHERDEAWVLSDRVAVLINGRIRQIGSPKEVFSFPVDEEVADFVKAGNILSGVIVSQSSGLASLDVNGQQLDVVSDIEVGTKVAAFMRYEDITVLLPTQDTASSARNRISGTVIKFLRLDAQVRVTIDCGVLISALITVRSWEDMRLGLGSKVLVSFKASAIHLIPRR
jgi:tungstate transport system ATP-binding protein